MVIERPKTITEQVSLLLRQRILEGVYNAHKRLPSESELAIELGVSRATVRSALTKLETEMLITRRQGDGTYINERLISATRNFGKIVDFWKHIEASGFHVLIKPLAVNRRQPTLFEAETLQIDPATQVLTIDRVFFADDWPVIFSNNVLSAGMLCKDVCLEELNEPLPVFFKHFCNQEFTYGITDLQSVLPDKEIAGRLLIDCNSPIIKFVEVFYSKEDRPLVFAANYYNDKRLHLRVARSFSS